MAQVKHSRFIAPLFFSLFIYGCVTFGPTAETTSTPQKKGQQISEHPLLTRALKLQEKGDLYQALILLQRLEQIEPHYPGLHEKVEPLQKEVREKAAAHVQKGKQFFDKNQTEAARREFLHALTYDPGNMEAIDHLKNRFNKNQLKKHTSSGEDSLPELSRIIYGDKSLAGVIAFFNNLAPDAIPPQGSVLDYPPLEELLTPESATPQTNRQDQGGLLQEEKDTSDNLETLADRALYLLNIYQYEKARTLADKILRVDPNHPGAGEIVALLDEESQNYYSISQAHLREGDPELARQELRISQICSPQRVETKTDMEYLDFLILARFAFRQGDYASAWANLNKSSTHEKTRFLSEELAKEMRLLAQKHLNAGLAEYKDNLFAAILDLQKAERLDPDNLQIQTALKKILELNTNEYHQTP